MENIISFLLFPLVLLASTFNISMENINLKTKCSQVLVYPSLQNPLQKRCYDYNLRESKFVIFKLNKDTVNRTNIKKRPGFVQDKLVPKKYRISNTCFTHTGYDKAHQAFDQAFDYDWLVLKTTFILSNVLPERPITNRVTQRKIENIIMNIAKNNDVIVIVGGIFGNKRLKNLDRCPIIPKKIYEIIWVKDGDKYTFVKMYIMDNETGKIDKIIFDKNKMNLFLYKQGIRLKNSISCS